MINKINRILKEVDLKFKELENEYRKRLNFYKGHKENKSFVDKSYDRVFGSLSSDEDGVDPEYQGVYSGNESRETGYGEYFTNNLTHQRNTSFDIPSTPLRNRYEGVNDNNFYGWRGNSGNCVNSGNYNESKKVRFAQSKSKRAYSHNRTAQNYSQGTHANF